MPDVPFEIVIDEDGINKIVVHIAHLRSSAINRYYKNIELLGQDLRQIARDVVRRSGQRKSGKTAGQTEEAKLFDPEGHELSVTPTEAAEGKKIVTPRQGYGRSTKVTPTDEVFYRWNEASGPGEAPMSHPANHPGWKDEWLRESIFYKVINNGQDIELFVDPHSYGRKGSKRSQLMPRVLEEGGTFDSRRSIPVGYTITTMEHAIIEQGDGKDTRKRVGANVGSKRLQDAYRKNKSGRTQRAHVRHFKQARVSFKKKFREIGKENDTMQARPFLEKAVERFMRQKIDKAFQNLIEK